MNDRELWSAIQAGKEHAFRELFYLYFSEMVHWAHQFVQDEGIAKDMAQDVFVKLWDQRVRLNVRGKLRPYLLQSTRNNCLNFLKKKKTATLSDHWRLPDSSHGVQKALEVKDLEGAVRKAINSLPVACRTVYLMRSTEDLPIKEIAKVLNISPKTVENQLTKARKIIMAHLKPLLTLLILIFIYFLKS